MNCEKLQKIEYESRGIQHLLEKSDECYYIGEYTAGKSWEFSKTNSFISNLKKPLGQPQNILRYKHNAEQFASECLSKYIRSDYVKDNISFIPIPPSKETTDPLYDPRMLRICKNIPYSHVLDLLSLSSSRPALHENGVNSSRRTVEDVYRYLRVNLVTEVPRQTIFIVDDVITSGSNFKACRRKILESYPGRNVVGLFLARCVSPPASEPEFFDFGLNL